MHPATADGRAADLVRDGKLPGYYSRNCGRERDVDPAGHPVAAGLARAPSWKPHDVQHVRVANDRDQAGTVSGPDRADAQRTLPFLVLGSCPAHPA
jgi:hypothetical protein